MITPNTGWILIEPLQENYSGLSHKQDTETIKKGRVLAVPDEETVTSEFNAVIKCPVKVGQVVSHTTIGFETIQDSGGRELRLVPFLKIIAFHND